MATTTEQIGAVLSSAGAHTLGAMVFWSLAGVRVPRRVFRERLAELNLEHSMSKDPSARGALSKALPAVMAGRRGILARRVKSGFGLVLEQITDNGTRVKVDHVASVSTDLKGDLVVEFHGDGAQERIQSEQPGVLERIQSEYSTVRDYVLTSDLSEILSTALNGSPYRGLFAALSLRERTGGLYFVHASHVTRMLQLRAMLEELAPSCSISVMTITGDAENLEQAATVARSTFAAQLKELREELIEFQSHLGGKAPSEYSIQVRAERYRELSARVDVFRDVLGGVAVELNQQISTARDEMVRQLEAL